jgi:hypothetical protein
MGKLPRETLVSRRARFPQWRSVMKRTTRRPRRATPRQHVYTTQIGRVLHSWVRDAPVGRAERRWLDAACALGLEHAIELHGEDAHESHGMTVAVVGRAAEQIWTMTAGEPRWGALDVEAAITRWAPHGDASFVDAVAWTLAAFVAWLGDRRILTPDELWTLEAQLDPLLEIALRSILMPPAEHAVN